MFVAKNSGDEFEVRSAALNALALMPKRSVSFGTDLSVLVADETEEPRLRETVAGTLVSIAVALASISEDDKEAIQDVERFLRVVSKIEGVLAEYRPELSLRLEPALQSLSRARETVSTTGGVWTKLVANPLFWPLWILFPPFACLPVWLLLLNYQPIWIWRINALLQKLPESKPVSELNLPFGLRGYLLISMFQFHPRVLDSWLNERWPKVHASLESMHCVADRNIHVPIPVSMNGRLVREPGAADFREEFLKPVTSLILVAEEGMGKTSLAFQIARWALADSVQERMANHRIVPVLIENDFENVRIPDLDSLILRIQQALQSICGCEQKPEADLVKHLLRTKRILVIFDNVTDVPKGIAPLLRRDSQVREILRAWIVTSPLREMTFENCSCVVEPMPVEIQDLPGSFQKLFEHCEKSEIFRDVEILQACLAFHRAAGWSQVPVWLFRMWGEWMLSAKCHSTRRDQPGSLQELLVRHVEEKNQTIPADERLEIASVVEAMKTVSWNCVKECFRPVATDKSVIVTTMGGESQSGRLLACLKQMGFLSFEGTSPERLRVNSIPLAENLASLHLCETLGVDGDAWAAVLHSIRQQAVKKIGCKSFIRALHSACLAKAEELGIPDLVQAEIGILAGKFPVEYVKANSDGHVRKMICQLSLPDPEDRKSAALGLIGLGSAAKGAIPALVSRLSRIDENLEVRLAIIRVLGDIGPQSDSVVVALVKIFKDPFSSLRPAATRALVRIGGKALAGLIEVAKDPRRNESFRLAVLKTICAFDRLDEQSVESLRTILKDKAASEAIRAGVAEALASAGESALASVPDLIDLMVESRTLCLPAANAIIAIVPSKRTCVISLFEMFDNRGSRGSESTLALFRDSLLLSKQSSTTEAESPLTESIEKAFERAASIAKSRTPAIANLPATHPA